MKPTRAMLSGGALLTLSAALAMTGAEPGWVIAPLAIFLGLIAVAPAFSSWSFFLPVTSHGDRSRPEVAITFDDGPDPRTMASVLEVLALYQAPATFFVVGKHVKAHPQLVRDLLARGHEVANHSFSHDPFLMLRSMPRLRDEVQRCQDELSALGVEPTMFRPPVGITNSRLPLVLDELKLECVCFSVRPVDYGNLKIDRLADKVLRRVRNGDVILLHDIWPKGDRFEHWLIELRTILDGLAARGLKVVPLSRVLGKPVMRPVVAEKREPAAQTPAAQSRLSQIADVVITVAQTIGIVAYPVTVYFGVRWLGVRGGALLMLAFHVPALVRTLVQNGRKALGLLGMGLMVLTLCGLAAILEDTRFMLAYPTLVNVALLGQFAWSLVKGPPMVERFARLQVADLGPAELRYCRSVTGVWCLFFVVNGSIITALALAAPYEWWAAYASGLSYLLVGLLFTVEFVVRRLRFGRFSEGAADRFLKVFLPRRLVERASPR